MNSKTNYIYNTSTHIYTYTVPPRVVDHDPALHAGSRTD